MPKAFDTWTVLKNNPIEKLSENLWRVVGFLPDGKTQRVMTLARMKNGKVLVHNPIALDEAQMKEIEGWGAPTTILVPGG